MIITAISPVPEDTANITTARFRISESIERDLTDIVLDAFDTVSLDSRFSLSSYLTDNAERLSQFETINETKQRVSSSFSVDLSSVTNVYRYNIYNDLMPVLITHEYPSPVPRVLPFVPSAVFTGIVIYAADEMPLYGEEGTSLLQPSVFPVIYDENMNTVASERMSDPEFLQQWGFAAFTDKLEESAFYERIGRYPFRTTAQMIFGNNRNDIIITTEAAKRLLYNEANRRLIREGRILIILAPETGR